MTNKKSKKVFIISSYDESCGNAYFARAIVEGLSTSTDCHAIGLNLRLTQGLGRRTIALGDAHIKEICKEVEKADGVNIQVEPQLYGGRENDVVRRLEWLFSANPHTSATIHNTRIDMPEFPWWDFVRSILRLNIFTAYRVVRAYFTSIRQPKMNRRIAALAKIHNVPVIVHTRRAADVYKRIFEIDNLYVHPLKFQRCLPHERDLGRGVLSDMCSVFALPHESVIIGIFGYVSQYKGHEDAVRALKFLPQNYHLFIFGRQHPASIRKDGGVDPFIEHLVNVAVVEKVADRAHFMGEYPPDVFMGLIAAVDVAWLPYREVGQDGSGIAAQCFDNAGRVVCSMSFAFDEVLALDPREFVRRVDIGNYLQIADATRIVMKEKPHTFEDCNEPFTFQSQGDLYLKSMRLGVEI